MAEHFFIAGAQRSGTTYLCAMLEQHPDIEMARPIRPEPKFFHVDRLYQEGIAYYQAHYFQGQTPVRGEKSTCYMESPRAIERLSSHFPGARILFMLREPIDRAISNYWFSVQNGLESLPLEEAFHQEPERARSCPPEVSVSPFAYLQRGRYTEQLALWERHFERSQLHPVIFEDVLGKADAIGEVYGFLGVDPHFRPKEIELRVNEGELRQGGLPAGQLRDQLVEYYREPNLRLSRDYGMDLSSWEKKLGL